MMRIYRESINQRKHAIVIGGSLAGLFAARVLSGHFERVTILERDPVNDCPEHRKGQPQTRHLHFLLAEGLRITKQLFPGIEQALVQCGAIVVDMAKFARWYHFGGFKVQFDSGLFGMSVSRPVLEWQIRRRVLDLPNVTLRSVCNVHQLFATTNRDRVVGVELMKRDHAQQHESFIADLIIDASGRGSLTPRWLSSLGYERPSEEEVKVRLGYATRLYRRLPGQLVGAGLVMISPTPPDQKRGTYLLPVEDNRWIVTAGGWGADYPPADEEGFLKFIRELPIPDIYDIISTTEPLSDIFIYRFPSNLRRLYERLKRFPAGYLVIGDAIASFNPVYGQGMTSAAMQAQSLDLILSQSRSLDGVWRRFFSRVAQIINIPWQLAVGEDFRFRGTEGRKPLATDLINAYVAKVHLATQHDSVVYAQFLRVMNLMAPPTSLLHPRIVLRLLRN